MSSRKHSYTVTFVTTNKLTHILNCIEQLSDIAPVQNLSVEEVIEKKASKDVA